MGDVVAMPKVTIDVPEEVAQRLKELEGRLRQLEADKTGAGSPVTESEVDAVTSGIGLELKRRGLQALDIDAHRVLVDGKPHAQVGRYEASYFTKEGPVKVTRNLFRECGSRNAKTVDAVSLRSGAVNGWLPDAAKAAAFLLQQGTSREAEATARSLGVLPYSRSSFERIGHEVGALHSVVRDEVETKLVEGYRIPRAARTLSVSVDRVAVPMEEPRPKPVGRPKRGAARRPVERVWRMAYVGTLTLHDDQGEALHSFRYGRMPGLGGDDLVDSLLADAKVLLRKRRSLAVVLLCDGAQEMVDLLDKPFNQDTLGVDVQRLVDFWHVFEKLGEAATVIHGTAASGVVDRWKGLLLNSFTARTRILSELLSSGRQDFAVGQERPVHAAITYLQNQGTRMDFAEVRAAGLPIGSGNVEATCKSLIGQRLVRTGSRWKEDTGQHVIDLRALALSQRFDAALDLTLAPLVRQVRRAA
jgi:hypothetical protein